MSQAASTCNGDGSKRRQVFSIYVQAPRFNLFVRRNRAEMNQKTPKNGFWSPYPTRLWNQREFLLHREYFEESGDPRDNFLGREDNRFLGGASQRGRLPARQNSSRLPDIRSAIVDEDLIRVQKELERGRDANTVYENGETLLHVAVLRRSYGISKLLLEYGSNPDNRIREALVHPHEHDILISDTHNGNGCTPVHYACITGDTKILELLLDAKHNQNLEIGNREASGTPLMRAASCGHVKTVEILLSRGADAKCRDPEERTAIMAVVRYLASENQRESARKIIRMLTLAGADINSRDVFAFSAYDIARTESLRGIVLDYGGHTAKMENIEHLFHWDVDRSRTEWPFKGKKRVVVECEIESGRTLDMERVTS